VDNNTTYALRLHNGALLAGKEFSHGDRQDLKTVEWVHEENGRLKS
jgi:hypothetical protein